MKKNTYVKIISMVAIIALLACCLVGCNKNSKENVSADGKINMENVNNFESDKVTEQVWKLVFDERNLGNLRINCFSNNEKSTLCLNNNLILIESNGGKCKTIYDINKKSEYCTKDGKCAKQSFGKDPKVANKNIIQYEFKDFTGIDLNFMYRLYSNFEYKDSCYQGKLYIADIEINSKLYFKNGNLQIVKLYIKDGNNKENEVISIFEYGDFDIEIPTEYKEI